jgi:hypothetical protein
VSLGDLNRRMFDDGARMHEYFVMFYSRIVVVFASDPKDLVVERVTM